MKRTDYINWDEYFMGIALLTAMRSKDPSSQVGACIVSPENKILSLGYNGMPIGCDDDAMPWEREGDPLDTKYMYVCHAELNAILNSAHNNLKGARYEYLLQDISGNAQQMGRCLSNEKMDELYSLLVKFTDASAEQKARHIEEVRAKHYPIIQPDGTWTCPQRGGRLVPRVARQGSGAGKTFWGCSNYPKCHFIYNE